MSLLFFYGMKIRGSRVRSERVPWGAWSDRWTMAAAALVLVRLYWLLDRSMQSPERPFLGQSANEANAVNS